MSHPRIHIGNGISKHSNTKEQFKLTVRMFKNWKKNHFGDSKLVSSHKIEALVHSVPDKNFFPDPVENFLLSAYSIIDELNNPNPIISSVCGNENIISTWPLQMRNIFRDQLLSSVASAHKAYDATTESEALAHWKVAFNL